MYAIQSISVSIIGEFYSIEMSFEHGTFLIITTLRQKIDNEKSSREVTEVIEVSQY